MAKLVCGCGYLGMRVAQRWVARGETVWATTRSPRRGEEFLQAGIRPVVADITHPWQLPPDAPPFTAVLFALGFDRQSGDSIERVFRDGLAHATVALPTPPDRFLYISSTGVYGQDAGEWVDEDSPCEPTRAGGRACLAAERWLAASPLGQRTIVLRLAGIYGPGRLPKLAAVARGEPLDAPANGYLNLIHVEDAAEIVVTAEECIAPPRTVAVADGHPVIRGEFYRELARLLGAPPPRFSPRSTSSAAQRGTTDKRVRNTRLLSLLPIELRFPTYRHGLAAIVAPGAG